MGNAGFNFVWNSSMLKHMGFNFVWSSPMLKHMATEPMSSQMQTQKVPSH